ERAGPDRLAGIMPNHTCMTTGSAMSFGKEATRCPWKARSSMAIRTIPLSRLETDLKKTLSECAETGETVVVEMPDQRLLAIHPLDPREDDSLIDELLATDPKFQALVAKSKAGPRKPFTAGGGG